MKKDELDFRIRLAIAKGRNIIYYRERDRRERAQYIHVVRDYRKTLLKLLEFIPESEEYAGIKSFFNSLVNIIDPKVKSVSCIATILEMKKLYEQQ